MGDTQKAIDHLKLFSKEENSVYWVLLLDDDPEADPIRNHPEYKVIIEDIKARFWQNHEKLRGTLEEKGSLMGGG